ncbi:hypothetical protein [Kurthia senegalensis]|uniref:hypothetical protein n=1 Tax=Kurthia senegalensis TaxID=1033740 RepID=UPI000287EA8D|nr:hypothetical protein [Kurthia senegalensis]
MKIVWAIFGDEELIERGKVDEFFWKGCRFDVFEEGKCPLTIQSNVNHGVLIEDIATALSNAIQTDDNQIFHTYITSQSYEVIFLGRDIEFRNFDPNTKKTLRRSMVPKIAFIDAFIYAFTKYVNHLVERNEIVRKNKMYQRLQQLLLQLNQLTK